MKINSAILKALICSSRCVQGFQGGTACGSNSEMSGVDACVKIRLTDREICDCRWLKNGFVYGIICAESLAQQAFGLRPSVLRTDAQLTDGTKMPLRASIFACGIIWCRKPCSASLRASPLCASRSCTMDGLRKNTLAAGDPASRLNHACCFTFSFCSICRALSLIRMSRMVALRTGAEAFFDSKRECK